MPNLLKRGEMFYSDVRWNGRRIRRALSPNERTAQRMVDEMLLNRRAEKRGDVASNISYRYFREQHIKFCRGSKQPKSAYKDELAFKYLETHYPIQYLKQITPALLDQLMGRFKAQGLHPNHLNRLIYSIKAGMRKAEEWKFIDKQDWTTVKRIKTTEARIEFFKVTEISEILDKLTGDYKTAAYVGFYSGLRLGEMIALALSDIDLVRKKIHITAKPNWQPKDYEKRSVPMAKPLQAFLRSRLANAKALFAHEWSMNSLSHMLTRELRELGFTGGAHKFRHSFASHLVMAGVPIYTVSKLLGHASVTTTEKHYAHLLADHIDESIKQMPKLTGNRL